MKLDSSLLAFGPRALAELTKGLISLSEKKLWLKILIGLFLGLGLGFLLGPTADLINAELASAITNWLALPGQIFIALIQMVVIPLVFSSVVRGIAASDNMQKLRSLGLGIGIYYLVTTVIAVIIGFSVSLIIKPGNYLRSDSLLNLVQNSAEQIAPVTKSMAPSKISMQEAIPFILPNNPMNALVSGQMLQIVLLAFFLGIALMALKTEEASPILQLLSSFQKVSMVVIHWAMYLAPWAVFGLMAKLMSQIGWEVMMGLSIYILTVLCGLAAVFFFYLFLIYISAKIRPMNFINNVKEVLLLAFSTSSSAAVMPLSISTVEQKFKVKPSISQFIIPLGTTINMDGTALYQAVATVFLAQVYGIDLPLSDLLFVAVTATVASVGAPGVPGVGIVVLSMALSSVGIPAQGVMLIMAVDRILDMFRTVINATGDLAAALVMDRIFGKASKA